MPFQRNLCTFWLLDAAVSLVIVFSICDFSSSTVGASGIQERFTASQRAKRHNVFPITSGPHGSNFHDVVSALKGLAVLDRGIEVDWFDGKKMTIMAFAFSLLGDMPQQQDNVGFKQPTASRSYRQCLV